MKKNLKNNHSVIWAFLLSMLIMACSGRDEHAHNDTYTCPMHPTVVSDKPATCPVCGMDLVRKARPGEEVVITPELQQLIKSPNENIQSDIATVRPSYKRNEAGSTLQGMITYDVTRTEVISSRVAGRIEKIYVKYVNQKVAKGALLAEIYSPELVTAQREFLLTLRNQNENTALVQAAKERIQLLGLTQRQIDKLITTKQVLMTVPIYSTADGIIVTDTSPSPASATASTNGSANMGGESMNNSGSVPVPINTDILREGAYVSSGQALFRVANTTVMRLEFNTPSTLPIKIGDTVQYSSGSLSGAARVDLVQPFLNEGETFTRVRAIVSNEQLRFGQIVTVQFKTTSEESLWLTRQAVLDLGNETIVFVKEKGKLRPRSVKTGLSLGNEIEIQQGLASGDEVARNAQFLVDSEGFIKTN